MKISKETMKDLWKFHEFVNALERKYAGESDDPCGKPTTADRIFLYSYAANVWFSRKRK